jgi:A/G-specific adenine glycosylase
LARFFNIELPIDSIKGKLFFADLAQQLLDKKSPGLYNQAIMDFGATLCKPKLPLCDECVLKKACKAFALGTVNILPVKENKIVKKQRWFFYILAEYKRNFYVIKRTKKDIWENLYEFVLIEVDKKIPPLEICQSAAFKKMFGKDFSVQNVSLFYKQQLTHQTINGYFIHIKLNTKPALPEYLHLSKSNMVKLAFPKFIHNYLQSANTLL